MSDPRHFEYYQCPDCGVRWRTWSPHSYEADDSSPHYQTCYCDACFEIKHAADLKEQEIES